MKVVFSNELQTCFKRKQDKASKSNFEELKKPRNNTLNTKLNKNDCCSVDYFSKEERTVEECYGTNNKISESPKPCKVNFALVTPDRKGDVLNLKNETVNDYDFALKLPHRLTPIQNNDNNNLKDSLDFGLDPVSPDSSVQDSPTNECLSRTNSSMNLSSNVIPCPPCPPQNHGTSLSLSPNSCFKPYVSLPSSSSSCIPYMPRNLCYSDPNMFAPLFKRSVSLATSDTSWVGLANITSVDEDDFHDSFSVTPKCETREEVYTCDEEIDCEETMRCLSPIELSSITTQKNIEQSDTAMISFSYDLIDQNNCQPVTNDKMENLRNTLDTQCIEDAFSVPATEFRNVPSYKRTEKVMSVYTSQTKNYDAGKIYYWTEEDDQKLAYLMKKRRGRVIKSHRDWEIIANEYNQGKSGKECHERWLRYVKPGVRKGQWKSHEDAILFRTVTSSTEKPFTRWSDLAQKLPGRAGKQIRDRWINYLDPKIQHLPFSREDDILIYEGHKQLGKKWAQIAVQFFNSVRSENQIKNRWYSSSFKKFVIQEYGAMAYESKRS